MLQEKMRFACKNRYKIHPTKTCIVVLSNKNPTKDCEGSLCENNIHALHLGVKRAAKKESSSINVKERISLARRTSFSDEHRSTWLDWTSNVTYQAYFLPRLPYGLETLTLIKGQVEQLSKYRIQTLRNIQSNPQRTSTSAVLLLLGALPLETELHRKKHSLAISVINSYKPYMEITGAETVSMFL